MEEQQQNGEAAQDNRLKILSTRQEGPPIQQQAPHEAYTAGDSGPRRPEGAPRRPRPFVHRATNAQLLRRSQYAALVAGQQPQGRHASGSLVIEPHGLPITAQIELAGALAPSGRATVMPPKRPSYLPARPAEYARHRYPAQQLSTSLGATALTGAGSPAAKPNRYSWAQMQRWHAAQNAAQLNGAPAPVAGAGLLGGRPFGAGGGGARQQADGAPDGHSRAFHYHLPSPFASAASRVLVVPNPIVNLGEHTKSRLIKIIEALKHFSEKWFSHVLLLLFLASYACLGAYIFISFEAPTEQWEKQLVRETRAAIVNGSYEQARQLVPADYFVAFRTKLEDYERLLNRMCANGMSSSSLENQWTFWGALFYSMTVFTTIGYGHLTPVTFAGRVATMIYAIFGIPILLMVLADLGKLLTRIIKYAFKKSRSCYNKLLGRKASVRTRQLISDHSNQYMGVARSAFERGFATYIQPYGSRIPGALREAQARVASLRHHGTGQRQRHQQEATIRVDEAGNTVLLLDQPAAAQAEQHDQGQGQPQKRPQMESSEVIVTPGKQTKPVSPKISGAKAAHPLADSERPAAKPAGSRTRKVSATSRAQRKGSVARSSSTSNMASELERHSRPAAAAKHSSVDQLADMLGGGKLHEQQPHQLGQLESNEDEEEEEDEEELGEPYDELDEDLDIPVSFALFLLITYMMFGAVIFSIWESWNFFDALYFVFISMSTIGFGDLVPQHPKRMIGTFAYLLFGLALTSMCINVVQEKIHATFLRAKMQIGEKMGFDLDHIMAGDYYDSGSAYGDDPDHMGATSTLDDDNGSCANSLAVSQTNSQPGFDQHQCQAASSTGIQQTGEPAGSLEHHSQQQQQQPDQASQAAAAHSPAKSKSKESLKWKKRSSAGSTDQHPASSIKRKASTSTKKLAAARQPSPLGGQPAVGPGSCATLPIRPQLETIRMVNLPVQAQLDERTRPRPAAPHINQPVEAGVRSFCEPLRNAFQSAADGGAASKWDGARRPEPAAPALQARGQASLLTTSRSFEHPRPSAPAARTGQNGSQQRAAGGAAHQRQWHQSERARSSKPVSRSLNSSRRASVSHELSRLDDLIVALSCSPPERFGPLLGIPSTAASRTTRSASPNVMKLNSPTPTPNSNSASPNQNSNNTSHDHPVTPQTRALDASANTNDTALWRAASISARPSHTHPGLVQRKRSPLESRAQVAPANRGVHGGAGGTAHLQRRRSSSGLAVLGPSLTLAARTGDSGELNLSESQAALDELEAVKYSAL